MTDAGFRRCRCGQAWAAHTMHDAAAIAGVHYKVLYRLRPKLGIGTLVHGKWHFQRRELVNIKPPRRGPPKRSTKETRQDWQRRYYQQNRERILEYHKAYSKTDTYRKRHALYVKQWKHRRREQQSAA